MTSDSKNALSASHRDTAHMHPNTRDASLEAEDYIKHCVQEARRHTEEYQAPGTVRLSGRDKLRSTTEGRAQRPNTRNVSFTGRAKSWHQLGPSSLQPESTRRRGPARIKGAARWMSNENFKSSLCKTHLQACKHKTK